MAVPARTRSLSESPKLGDVFQVRLRIGRCEDVRPCIVIAPPLNNKVMVVPLSGAMGLYRGLPLDFLISQSSADFIHTGLKKDCFAIGDMNAEIDLNGLSQKRGELQGGLRRDFLTWI